MDDVTGARQQAAVKNNVALTGFSRAFELTNKQELEKTAMRLQQQNPWLLWVDMFNAQAPGATSTIVSDYEQLCA